MLLSSSNFHENGLDMRRWKGRRIGAAGVGVLVSKKGFAVEKREEAEEVTDTVSSFSSSVTFAKICDKFDSTTTPPISSSSPAWNRALISEVTLC
mmetsp:Transcript_33359/g.48965  ORF Transcript_33359/g.48965 Transcript_33359/m.48965 type:complete len:95 (-) Transcript_33359:230-514(-)